MTSDGIDPVIESLRGTKAFNIEPYVPTPFEAVVQAAHQEVLAQLPHAETSAMHMALTAAARSLTISRSGWQEKLWSTTPTTDQLIADYTDNIALEEWIIEQQRAARMLRAAMALPADEGKMRIAVARFGDGPNTAYRALGIYPSSEQAQYDIPRTSEDTSTPDIVYITLHAVCNATAVDDLVTATDQPMALSINNRTLQQLIEDLGFDLSFGPQQNLRFRDDQGNVVDSRDPKLYILFAIKGWFGNETNRYLLSDFHSSSANKEDQ